MIGYLPSLLYRISFKANAVAYLPFIWVAHTTLRNPLPVKSRLERITKGELEQVRRAISWGIMLTLAAKISLIFGWVERAKIEDKLPIPSKQFIERVLVPNVWPWWQITLASDAVLTFLLLYISYAAFSRINKIACNEESVLTTVSTISFVRSILSIATISHFFYVAAVQVVPASWLHLLAF